MLSFTIFLNGHLPTVTIGCLRGTRPKLYWKNPRPTGTLLPLFHLINFNTFSQIELGSASPNPYTFVSPKEKTGTKDALNIEHTNNVLLYVTAEKKIIFYYDNSNLLPGFQCYPNESFPFFENQVVWSRKRLKRLGNTAHHENGHVTLRVVQ